jgi:tetratricopeptide (TPR) repeat protein
MSENGHKRLADACWGEFVRQPSAMSAYAVRNAATHLRHAARFPDLFALLEDDRFLQQLLRLSGPSALRRELIEGLTAAESEGSIEKIKDDHPWSVAVARGLASLARGVGEGASEFLEKATSAKSRVVAGLGWLELGWFHKDHYTMPDRSRALDMARRSLEEAQRALSGLGLEGLLAEAQRSLAWVLKDSDRPDDAEKAFLAARSMYQGLGDNYQVAWTERDLGALYRDQARWEEAKTSLNRAQMLFRDYDDRLNLAITLKDIGLLQLSLALRRPAELNELLRAADETFTKARDVAATTLGHDLDAWLRRYEGISWAAAGRVEAGREAIEQSRPLFKDFVAANQVLCRLCADRITEIGRPHLLELYGHEPVPRSSYEELFRKD